MSGFFELAEEVWAEADQRREGLAEEHGKDLGDWFADVRQYGSAWWGDVWEWTAIGAENHPAFSTIPATHPWDDDFARWPSLSQLGGWRKPHKPESEQDEHGFSEATQIGTLSRDGWTTWAVVQP